MVYIIAVVLGLTLYRVSYSLGYSAGHRDGMLFSNLLRPTHQASRSTPNPTQEPSY